MLTTKPRQPAQTRGFVFPSEPRPKSNPGPSPKRMGFPGFNLTKRSAILYSDQHHNESGWPLNLATPRTRRRLHSMKKTQKMKLIASLLCSAFLFSQTKSAHATSDEQSNTDFEVSKTCEESISACAAIGKTSGALEAEVFCVLMEMFGDSMLHPPAPLPENTTLCGQVYRDACKMAFMRELSSVQFEDGTKCSDRPLSEIVGWLDQGGSCLY